MSNERASDVKFGSGTRVKVGDVVRLRSGGPLMTVTELRGLTPSECTHLIGSWMHDGELRHREFPIQCVVKVSDRAVN